MRRSRAARWARLTGALALPVLVLTALGARTGAVPSGALVPALALGFGLGIVALTFGFYALADIWHSGAEGAGAAIAGVVYAAPVLLLLAAVAAAAFTYPPVIDVSTDPADPPILAERAGETNRAAADPGAPAVEPRSYELPIAQVYETAAALVEERGWRIEREARPPSLVPEPAPVEPDAGADEAVLAALAIKRVMTQSRSEAAAPPPPAPEPPPEPETAAIEAVAPTLLFRFPDRVALRFRGGPEETRVDMRSVSAVGAHDLGQNARRIGSFLAALDAALLRDPATGLPPAPASPSVDQAPPASR
jgi:hypothetical protein